MSDEQIQTELVDEEIQAEPVFFDEWTLAKRAEAAEYEDRAQRAKNELKQLRAEADDRDAPPSDPKSGLTKVSPAPVPRS